MTASLTWLGHSTVRLVLPDGRVVMIDPWMEGNPACPPSLAKLDRCDLIVLTHGHADHVGEVKALVQEFDPLVVGNYDLCSALTRTLGAGRYEGMNTGGTLAVEGVRITLTPAFHSSALETPSGPMYAGMPNGVVIGVDHLASLYHAGDTDVFGGMELIARLLAPRICLLPIGDRFTMGAKGAALAAELLNPRVIIPIHYKTFPILAQSADEFRTALSLSFRDRLVVPDVGQALPWTAQGVG